MVSLALGAIDVFTVTASDLTERKSIGGAGICVGGSIAPHFLISGASATGTVTITGGSIALPDTVAAVTAIALDGAIYYAESGAFTFNPDTGELTLVGITGNRLTYFGETRGSRAVFVKPIAPPDLFVRINATRFRSTRQWRGHPSGEVEFSVPASRRGEILPLIEVGAIVELFGVGYRIASRSISENFRTGELSGTVRLQGKWDSWRQRSPLDIPIKLKRLGESYTAGDLCALVGVPLRGNTKSRKIPRDITSEDTVTARQALDELAILSGLYVDYESADFISLVDWKATAIRPLPREKWTQQDLVIDDNGTLAREVSNAELVPDGVESLPGRLVNVTGDRNPESPPTIDRGGWEEALPIDTLRSMAIAFDAGGQTKTRKTTITWNGTIIEEREEVFGFVVRSTDVYAVSPDEITFTPTIVGIDTLWQKVRDVTTIYKFDSDGRDDGYRSTGWEFFRFRQESEALEVATLQQEILGTSDPVELARINASIALYTFTRQLVNPSKSIVSDSLVNYYRDLDRPAADETTDYIEPRYAKTITLTEDSLRVVNNPDSTVDEPLPPIVSGRKRLEVQEQNVLVPLSRSTARTPEVYLARTRVTNQEGENFNKAALSETEESIDGRPSALNLLDRRSPTNPNQAEVQSDRRGIYNTPDAPEFDPEIVLETFSFTGAEDEATVKLAAETQIGWENTEGTVTTSVQCDYVAGLRTGDRLLAENRTWVTLSIEEDQEKRPDGWIRSEFTLSLGEFKNPGLN